MRTLHHPILRTVAAVLVAASMTTGAAMAGDTGITLHVDSAPNIYGSGDWPQWWEDTKADAAAGDFVDMRSGVHPGTHLSDPYDFIVYSTGDLGKRVHWIYWLPGETVAALDQRFEVKMIVDWDGIDYTYDWNTGGLVEDEPELGWIQPGSWVDYDDGQGNVGVIGSFGHAWWAWDDDAEPYNTDGDPYNETDQADVDALRQAVLSAETHLTGLIRFRETPKDPWQIMTLPLYVVPSVSDVVEFDVVTGTHVAGDVGDLLTSDDSSLTVRSGFGAALADLHKMETVIHFSTPVETPSLLNIAVEAAIDETDGTGRLFLRNWNTGDFELVTTYSVGLTDELVTVEGIDATNYVSESGEIDLMVKHIVNRPFLAFQFDSFIDLAEIVVE